MFAHGTSCNLQYFYSRTPRAARPSLARTMLVLGLMSFASPTSEASAARSRDEEIGRAVERTAVRFVRTWGFSTVEMVAARFRMTSKASVPRGSLARQAL